MSILINTGFLNKVVYQVTYLPSVSRYLVYSSICDIIYSARILNNISYVLTFTLNRNLIHSTLISINIVAISFSDWSGGEKDVKYLCFKFHWL